MLPFHNIWMQHVLSNNLIINNINDKQEWVSPMSGVFPEKPPVDQFVI
jgi:hypothetical protein